MNQKIHFIINTIPRLTVKKRTLIRRALAFSLALTMLFTDIAVTVTYAQQIPPVKEKTAEEKKADSFYNSQTTLITEGETSGPLPYTGERYGIKSVLPLMVDDGNALSSATVMIPATVRKLEKDNYRPNEEIKVVIENGLTYDYKTELVGDNDVMVSVETDETITGDAKIITVTQPSSFRPGKYKLRLTDNYGGISEQDFRWGVLAVNPDKSVYMPNETANLAIAVLDEKGEMVCDAQVELQITDPAGKKTSLSTDNKKIIVNPECISHDFTLKPDYETNYQTAGKGVYKMLLKAQTKNGAYNISDSFEVRDSIPFDVKRISATRIYPPHTYPVTMEITANQDFEGTVTETVPASFKIGRQGQDLANLSNAPDPAASESADILAPDPVRDAPFDPSKIGTPQVIAYNTVSNLTTTEGSHAVLGASIPGLSMPFSGPYPVSQEFGQNLVYIHDQELYREFGMHGHDGTDFAMPEGTPILAVDDGKVVLAGDGDYGTTIVIQHAWGKSYYGHLSGVDVKLDQQVARGSHIGRSGNTGISTGPHLHFGIKPNENESENGYYGKVDPAYYLGMKASGGQVLGVSTQVTDEQFAAPVSTEIQILTWKINVKKGDTIKIGYNYLAPRISPQFYTLGPAVFTDTKGQEVFHEERKWQIAADALDYKTKRGTFEKSTCAATCTQSVTGIGFKPKAIIFEWTTNTAAGSFSAHNNIGKGFVTASSSANLMSERSVSFCSEDAVGTSDTSSRRSNTKAIMIQSTDCDTATAVVAEADLSSFDADGFTLSWTTNNVSPYIIHYTAIGGADVSDVLVSSFNLTTAAGTQTVAEPGFRPDFVMFLSTDTTANNFNSGSGVGGRMNVGFASSSSKQASTTMWSDDNVGNTDSRRQQRTDASITLLSTTGTQAGIVALSSFETNGFVLSKTSAPSTTIEIFYLAIQGGQHTVGTFTQPTSRGNQSVSAGFRPSGVMTLAASTSATTSILTTAAAYSAGGASASPSAAAISQSSLWSDDVDNYGTSNNATSARTDTVIEFGTSPLTGSSRTVAKASLQSIDPTGFTVYWSEADSVARQVLYWAAGSVTASQEDYRWYKNINSITPTTALEDENQSTIIPRNKPYARLRASISTGGNGLNASSQNFKLQYYSGGSDSGQSATNDWCNDTTGVTCVAPGPERTTVTEQNDWCNDGSGVTCNTDWGSRRKITIDNSASSENLTNFPLLVKLDSTRIDYNKTKSAGEDLRFVDPGDSTVVLSHEIESWNESGDSYVWVEVPQINAGSTTDYIWMYYDNASAASGQDVSGTWSNGYAGVWHLKENPATAGAGGILDSTSNANNGTDNNGMDATDQVTGKIGTAIDFNGLTQGITLGTPASLELDTEANFTIQAWVKPSTLTGAGCPTAYTYGRWGASLELVDGTSCAGTAGSINHFRNNTTNVSGTNVAILSDWNFISVTRDATDTKLYFNGNHDTTGASTTINNSAAGSAIGNEPNLTTSTDGGFQGSIDEVRVSNVVRSPDWMKADYLSMTDAVNTFGDEEPSSASTTVNGGWNVRQKITFNNSASGTNLTDFPVLVKLDSSRINYDKVQDAGEDLRFVDPSDNTTVLSHEIESWNESGDSYVWVKVPQIDANSTSDYIWMYFNNAEADDGQDAANVWDSSYTHVYHLQESNSGTTITDSTSSQQNGAKNAASQPSQITGKISNAQDFTGTPSKITTASPGLPTGDFTYETWAKFDSVSLQWLFDANNAGSGEELSIIVDTTLDITLNGVNLYNSTGTFTTGGWYHIVVTRSGSAVRAYINGAIDASTGTDGTALAFGTCSLYMGTNASGACGGPSFAGYVDGIMDEVRISDTARSADWIEAEYLTSSDAMNSYSEELPYTTGGTSIAGWTDVTEPWCNDTSGVSCDTSWGYRKRVTFNSSAIDSNLTNFPVLVKLDATRIDYSKTQDDGDDIRFVDPNDPTTVLSHEIESWNEAGESFVWVEVPQVNANSTTDSILMYYGNASVASGQDGTGTWDNSLRGVWHMADASGTTADDETSLANDLILSSASWTASGKINGAWNGDGAKWLCTWSGACADDNDLDFNTGSFSISLWFKSDAAANPASQEYIVDKEPGVTNGGYAIYVNTSGQVVFGVDDDGTTFPEVNATSTTDFYDGTWHHITAVKTSTTSIALYVDGTLAASTSLGATTGSLDNSDPFIIGSQDATDDTDDFNGDIDQVEVSNTALTADWIKAEYSTEADQMNTFGSEETQTSSAWKFKNNTSVTNGTTITSAALSTSTAGDQMTYQESTHTSLIPTTLAAGAKREWDFSLDGTAASPRRTYYFRITTAEGEPLTSYTRYPTVTFGVPHIREMRHGKWTNYKQKQPFTF